MARSSAAIHAHRARRQEPAARAWTRRFGGDAAKAVEQTLGRSAPCLEVGTELAERRVIAAPKSAEGIVGRPWSVASAGCRRRPLRGSDRASADARWVNAAKSSVDQPSRRKLLGFSFTTGKAPARRRIAPQALARFKARVRELTRRTKGVSLEQRIEDLRTHLTGWVGYLGFCQTPSVLQGLDRWVRRRLPAIDRRKRSIHACKTDGPKAIAAPRVQRRNGRNRFRQLFKRDVPRRLAAQTAASPGLNIALPNATFAALGLPSLVPTAA